MTTTGSGGSGGGGDHYEYPSCSSPGQSTKNRLKFLCSYGGKILPRPSDGILKYVGGDTRVIVVRRSIFFAELKEKIEGIFRRSCVIKYQLVSGDLDVLVTVTSDEDLVHMIDEYDRLDALHPRSPSAAASPRFRLFLFPTSSSASNSDHPTVTLDQGFFDAINTVLPASPHRTPIFTISAASSTVTSPSASMDGPGAPVPIRPNVILSSGGPAGCGVGGGSGSGGGGGGGMQRIKSTPDLDSAMHRVQSTPNLGGGLLNPGPNGGAGPQQHRNVLPHSLQPQQQHQYNPQNVYTRQVPMGMAAHGAKAGGGGGGGNGVWRSAPPRHEAYGGRMPQPQIVQRGGIQYYGGGVSGGGNMTAYGNPEDSNSSRTVRSSSSFCAMPRESVIWE